MRTQLGDLIRLTELQVSTKQTKRPVTDAQNARAGRDGWVTRVQLPAGRYHRSARIPLDPDRPSPQDSVCTVRQLARSATLEAPRPATRNGQDSAIRSPRYYGAGSGQRHCGSNRWPKANSPISKRRRDSHAGGRRE